MTNTWKELDAEQKKEAPPSTCRYCGEPIYWETLRGGKKRPVNATDFERHLCERRGAGENPPRKEAEMLTDKGHCPHGEFNLAEGCPQCIAERQAQEGKGTLKTAREIVEKIPVINDPVISEALRDLEPDQEEVAPANSHQLAEEDGIIEADDEDESYCAPYNALYHPPYRLQDGTIVPSVTTVLKVLDKGEQLQDWIWECGRQGLDYRKVRDAAGSVGTLAHYLIACHLEGSTPLPGEYSPEEVEKANKCFAKYLAWEKQNPLSPVIIETPFVSEEFKFGGTPDLLAEIGGDFVLIDFKTGGAVYNSYLCQLAAYRHLLEEQGWPVAGARVIRASPDDSEVEVAIALDLDRHWQIFQHALAIWLRGWN